MKIVKNILLTGLLSVLLFCSCRGEIFEESITPNDDGLKANSSLATAMQRTSLNDGSEDNILDMANCFTIKLPVTVTVNGIPIVVNSLDDLDLIEDNLEAFLLDDDIINFQFPITIIYEDFSEEEIDDQDELEEAADKCPGENEFDDDIECIDFQYPISASIFDPITENFNTIVINNDFEMYAFIDDLDDDLVVTLNFPIVVILSDGTVETVSNSDELENIIESSEDDCDEDDDFDFTDDDCFNCTTSQLTDILTTCTDWTIDRFDLGFIELEDVYENYTFNFNTDGTLVVRVALVTYSGTWSSSGSGENITLILNIIGLPDFDASWNLHEIEEDSVDLRVGNNRLIFESDCD